MNKSYSISAANLDMRFISKLKADWQKTPLLNVAVSDGSTGKWGMARLWRAWMSSTAKFMAGNGVTMPLAIKSDGGFYGQRAFNEYDAHELFTSQWLGVDSDGARYSWAKKPKNGVAVASKGLRFLAMQKHQNWMTERGITHSVPRDSEFFNLLNKSES